MWVMLNGTSLQDKAIEPFTLMVERKNMEKSLKDMIFPRSRQVSFQELISGSLEHPAKTSVLQEKDKDLQEIDQALWERFFDSSEKPKKEIDLNGLSMKTLKGCLAATEDETFSKSSFLLMNWGMTANGKFLTQRLAEMPPPQNRERVYTIGHLRSRGRRKVFPVSGANSEANIKVVGTIRPHRHSDGDVHGVDGISPTLTSRDHKDPRLIAIKQVGQLYDSNSFGGNPQPGRIYDAEGLSPTLNTCSGGNRMPKIIDPRQTRADEDLRITYFCPTSTSIDCKRPKPITIIDDTYGYEGEPRVYESEAPTLRSSGGRLKVAFVNQPKYGEYKLGEVTDTLTSTGKSSRQHVFIGASRGRNPENPSDRTTGSPTEQRLEVNQNGTSNTLTSVQKDNLLITDYRIRKLTPKECWRLQGFPDYCIERAIRVGVSDSQLYKQAGNAISVNVAYVVGKAIMNEMKNDAGEY